MVSPKTMQRARRTTQTVFLVLFFWLLLATFYHGVLDKEGQILDTLPYPVSLFLYIDPLAALSTLLSTGSLYADLLWSLCIIVPTLFLGRWFCGWVCPMGTIHNLFWSKKGKPAKVRAQRNRSGGHQSVKYGVLFFFLGAALAGTVTAGLLDPLCFLIRSMGLSILPALDRAARGAIDLVPSAQGLHRLLDQYFLGPNTHRFHGGWIIGSLFILAVALNLYMPRFWCRVICPLGALLGVLSRFTLYGLHKDPESCKDCNLCLLACQGAASPEHGKKWKAAECFLCFNCTAACPDDSLAFRFGFDAKRVDSRIDLSRRGFVGSLGLGLLSVPLARATTDPGEDHDPAAVRPPGSCAEADFLARCIKCGQCMKVCPNNAIHPALLQGGVEGLFSPVIIPRIGYCEPTCTLCAKVCPTGAIRAFTAEDKKANRVKIGTAFFDRGRCLPWAMNRSCMVCEEFCPTSPKAIWFEKGERVGPEGEKEPLNLPRVDPSRCTGCGVCENVCPVADRAAIRVTSVGESRSKENQILLDGGDLKS